LRIARERGVTIVGKTNLSEFAVGVSGSNYYFGTPINPVAEDRVPGGSSSGSAVAVAMNLADIALGTDTAGSIRVPAACCGVAGLKTTFGLVSTKGVYPLTPKYLDTVGPMAKDVDGLVVGMGLLQENFGALYAKAKAARPSARKIRIGRLRIPGTNPAIDRAIDARLAERGFQVVPLGKEFLRAWTEAQHDGNLVAAAGAWYNNHAIGRKEGVGTMGRVAIWFGDIVFSLKYNDEAKRQQAIGRDVDRRVSISSGDALLLQGNLLPDPTLHAAKRAKQAGAKVIFNAAPYRDWCKTMSHDVDVSDRSHENAALLKLFLIAPPPEKARDLFHSRERGLRAD
jgi:amidase